MGNKEKIRRPRPAAAGAPVAQGQPPPFPSAARRSLMSAPFRFARRCPSLLSAPRRFWQDGRPTPPRAFPSLEGLENRLAPTVTVTGPDAAGTATVVNDNTAETVAISVVGGLVTVTANTNNVVNGGNGVV